VTLRRCKICTMRRVVPQRIKPKGWKCKVCLREINRVKNRERRQWIRTLPYDHPKRVTERERKERAIRRYRATPHGRAVRAAANRRWRRRHPDRASEASRRWKQAVYADPDRAEEFRENARIYQRDWRRNRGINVRVLTEQEYQARYGSGYRQMVSAKPLRPVLMAWLEYESIGRLAARSGVSDRLIRRVRDGQEHIAWPCADRLCVAMGYTFSVVYGTDVKPQALKVAA
jgi:hypothetical protein